MRTRIRFTIALSILLCVPLMGCPRIVVSLSPDDAELTIGSVLDYDATSTSAKDQTFTWTSSNPQVAVIASNGVATGLSAGTTEITARGTGSGVSATTPLTVVAGSGFNTTLPTDPAATEPDFESEVTVDRCTAVVEYTDVAATIETWQGKRFHRLGLAEAGIIGDTGKPAMPMVSLFFAVPGDAQTKQAVGAKVSVEEESPRTYTEILPYPVQPIAWDRADLPTPDFEMDEAFYNSSDPYPEEDYTTDLFEIGNLTILRVNLYPLRYYPAAKELVLNRRLSVEVEFEDTKALAPPAILGDFTGAGHTGNEALAAILVNDAIVRRLTAQDLLTQLAPIDPIIVNDDQFELLIITRPSLFTQARRLAVHRQSQGWRVALASLDETTYPDENAIRDYIMDRDEGNTVTFGGAFGFPPETTPCMRAVLIFGDVELIPPFAGLNVGLEADPTDPGATVQLVGTDLYYAVLRGLDDKPDVWLGRIPADDNLEAKPVVDKLIHYDELPATAVPEHVGFYGQFQDDVTAQFELSGDTTIWNNSLIASGTDTAYLSEVDEGQFFRPSGTGRDEDWYEVIDVRTDTEMLLDHRYTETSVSHGTAEIGFRDGRADRPFIDTTERVRRFMNSLGVTTRYGYAHEEGPDPILFQDGSDLPPELLVYAWNATEATIHNNWISGLDGIILQRDHGWVGGSGWSHPNYDQESFAAMTTPDTAFYPFVLSMNCQSGWYDAPVDRVLQTGGAILPDLSTGVGRTCFCVEALLYPEGGALAILGASRDSSSGPNDVITDGIFRAMYEDYLPGNVRPGPTGSMNDVVGSIVLTAMFYHDIYEPRSDRSQYYYELYNLFGDPTTRLRLPE